MNAKNAPLLIIGIILVAGIAGLVVYGVSQNGKDDMSQSSGSMNMNMNSENKSDSSTTASADAKETDTVTIQDFAYSPSVIKVKAGTKVTWTNKDSVQHNVVGDDLEDLSGPLLKKGESFSYTFDKAGTYSYHCMPHPYMKGTVIVTE